MKKLYTVIFLLLIAVIFPKNVKALEIAGSSAVVKNEQILTLKNDLRVKILKDYLEEKKSPLSSYAEEFIKASDKYSLDWRLIPAITGVESSFGRRIPKNSFNAYGWANGNYSFGSWEESIEVVAKTLREKYLDRGATDINKIARRYAPPSSTWAGKVKFFMGQIDKVPLEFHL